MRLTKKSLFEHLDLPSDKWQLLLAIGDTRPARREYRAAKFKRAAAKILAKKGGPR